MTDDLLSLSTDEFIAGIDAVASKFDSAAYPQQYLPAEDWALLVRAGVLLPTLPSRYGGRDSHVEMCRVAETAAEWNLALGVYVIVNTALALLPVVKWAGEEAKEEMLPRFGSGEPLMAGLAATEPGAGSALSAMTTTFEEVDGGYRIRGRKHWQALSSSAHWWLVVAKHARRREYGYFIVKREEGFRTVQLYEAVGLKLLDYGVNDVDVVVPRHRRIDAEQKGMTSVDLFLASRSLLAAAGAGFLRRISREAHAYADGRQIGRKQQSKIGFVRYRLADIDASAVICQALNHYLRTELDIKGDMTAAFPAVQALKTVATERIVRAAQSYQQLTGGEGYRCGSPSNIAGQAFLDSRVFTIFDGNNDMLSQQLTAYCLTRRNGRPLSEFLADWPLTAPGVATLKTDLTFLDRPLDQTHQVLAGRAIGYLFAVTQVLKWAEETGAGPGRLWPAVEFLRHDIAGVAAEFRLMASGILDTEGEPVGAGRR
ncbi:alkylation response protein AidB-like acyl-CoA dehydrogenase [Actinomadura hallensis]|uniref:Alkylation response protein AidB-like acyl-CoA dehydrogenase n=1 Tax=Actinomadura hallensis TaxID=337895 RepID=A0A543IJX2_9ACTN|nr:acyl-CoA dehydrogenase family protein [Actinomadura hallensis]TQM70878.1 alkylation response protein AidB-like acyl-CoA dehydrogenase [Actinomadura hallensis]HLV73104.1 acyl-CoA dehydrogenase family protein [Vulgatibacteraceae bacterium]